VAGDGAWLVEEEVAGEEHTQGVIANGLSSGQVQNGEEMKAVRSPSLDGNREVRTVLSRWSRGERVCTWRKQNGRWTPQATYARR
jgi:hypothetical protein